MCQGSPEGVKADAGAARTGLDAVALLAFLTGAEILQACCMPPYGLVHVVAGLHVEVSVLWSS